MESRVASLSSSDSRTIDRYFPMSTMSYCTIMKSLLSVFYPLRLMLQFALWRRLVARATTGYRDDLLHR